MITTSPIPCIVSTVTNKVWTHVITIPENAPEIEAAAAKTLTFIDAGPTWTKYSDLGLSENWAAFSELSGIC